MSFTTDLSFITEGLSYKLNIGAQNSDADRAARVIPGGGGDLPTALAVNKFETSSKLIENYFNYVRTFNNLTISGLLGTSYQEFREEGFELLRDQINSSEIDPIFNFESAENEIVGGLNSFLNIRKLQSYFGRVNLSLSDKYLLTASVRVDGSSVFGTNNQFATFPAAALGWNISNEDFLKDSNVFSNLKLRLGWGETGNQAIPVKLTQASFVTSASAGYNFGDNLTNGLIAARTANPDLKWETTTQTNIGLDWSILDSKVSGTLDYYTKTTKDLFLEVAAQSPAIVSTVFVNSDAEIENKGFEFALNAKLIKTDDFSLDFGGNIAFLDNEIKNLAADIEIGIITAPGATGETSNIFRTGESSGAFFMKRFLGFENGVEVLSDNKEIVGDAIPDYTYGFYFNANYKKWDLSLNFNGSAGNQIFNNTARIFSSAQSLIVERNNVFTKFLDSAESGSTPIQTSSRYLEDGDYLRLNNASIGYNFDASDIKWLKKARVYITGQNLFVITDYSGFDPEVNSQGGNVKGVDFGAFPSTRTILLGLNISIN